VRPRAEGAKPFVHDSMIYDQLVETLERQRLFITACARGQIELLITHV
jgi:hypothetical protein